MSEDEKSRDQLESLEAYVEALRGNSELALQQLANKNDPDSIRRRISILLETNKINDAIELINKFDISNAWVELAVYTFAKNGNNEKAVEYLKWSELQNDTNLVTRSCIQYIDGSVKYLFHEKENNLTPASISEDEKQFLVQIAETINPICELIILQKRIDTEISSQLLIRYLDILYLLGEHDKQTLIFEVLLTRKPIPMKVGEAILQGIGKPTKEIVTRLIDENPTSFHAGMLASIILAEKFNDITAAKEKLDLVRNNIKTEEEGVKFCDLLYEFSDKKNPDEYKTIEKECISILGKESLYLSYIKSDHLIHINNVKGSIDILEKIRDENDPYWLRGYANAKIKENKLSEALIYLKKLALLRSTPEVYNSIYFVSKKLNKIDEQKASLQKILELNPENINARLSLAMLYADNNKFLKAAEQFEIARAIEVDNESIISNLAVSYYFGGELDKALAVLNSIDEKELSGSLKQLKAKFLQSSGQVNAAFSELEILKNDLWEKPEYLLGYIQLAYSAGKEKEAHEAFSKLQELHAKGQVDENLMQIVHFDKIKELVKEESIKNKEIKQNILVGKIPWLMAAQMQGEVPLWSWLLKTQDLMWLSEDPVTRATYSIYSTNSYHPILKDKIDYILDDISCPPKNTTIVIDLSALITINELGLIDQLLDYFNKIIIPKIYFEKALDDSIKLQPHQLSRKSFAEKILSLVNNNSIQLFNTFDSDEKYLFIDEYKNQEKDDHKNLKLNVVCNVLYKNGKINDLQMDNAKSVIRSLSTSNEIKHEIKIGTRLIIDELTLETLYTTDLLDIVIREFAVFLTNNDHNELIARKRAFDTLEYARKKHNDLWLSLRKDSRVDISNGNEEQLGNEYEELNQNLSISALQMARQKNIPLFVDDRFCQAILRNEKKSDEYVSFGTDKFILSLLNEKFIEPKKAAKLLLQLINWRYRFIILPPIVMKSLVDEYITHPPGQSMRVIAKYVHDCMRDPGLYCGIESTKPPVPIAVRLYQTWTRYISELVISIWADENISDNNANEFTNWAMTELLPSPPKGLNQVLQERLASLTKMMVLTNALIYSSPYTNTKRINLGIRKINKALGISDYEYFDIVMEVARDRNTRHETV